MPTPPVINLPAGLTTAEDTRLVLTGFSFSDADAHSGNYTLSVSAASGMFWLDLGWPVETSIQLTSHSAWLDFINQIFAVGGVSFIPAANSSGPVNLTFSLSDGALTTTTSVTLEVTPVNDAPTIEGIPSSLTVVEDQSTWINLNALVFLDIDSASITVTLTPSAGTFQYFYSKGGVPGMSSTAELPGSLTLTGSPSALSSYFASLQLGYTGAANASGDAAASIIITANDGTGPVTLGTIPIDITPVNDAPTGAPTATLVDGTEDAPYTVSAATLLQGFSDVDSTLSVTNLRASNGTVVNNGDGSYTITPTADVFGLVTLTYDVTDGSATLANQTRSYRLAFVNDPPTATGVPGELGVLAGMLTNLDLSAITLIDTDAGSHAFSLTVSSGRLFVAGTDRGGTYTDEGLAEHFDALLNTPSMFQFVSAPGAVGAQTALLSLGMGGVPLGNVSLRIQEKPSLVVTTLSDVVDEFDGLTSLREAIAFANAGDADGADGNADTITFAADLTGVIRLGDTDANAGTAYDAGLGTLIVTEALTIDGDGRITITGDRAGDDTLQSGSTVLTDAFANGARSDNVRLIDAGADITLAGLTLTGGMTNVPVFTNAHGGAVYGSAVTLVDSIVTGNFAYEGGGGIAGGSLAVTRSTVSGNVAQGNAGGIFAWGLAKITDSRVHNNQSQHGSGGGVAAHSVTVSGSEIANNTAERESGGGIFANSASIDASTLAGNSSRWAGGGLYVTTNATITASAITGNVTGGEGGGIKAGHIDLTGVTVSGNQSDYMGGGIRLYEGGTISNTTIHGNTALYYEGGGISTSGNLTVTSSTITANVSGGGYSSATGAGGIDAVGVSVTLVNAIVTGNRNRTEDIEGLVTLAGGNIVGQTVTSAGNPTGVTSAAAVFAQTITIKDGITAGALADNGGPVMTVALNRTVTNPAIDASDTSAPANDARGAARFDNPLVADASGAVADLGAFEAQNSTPTGAPTATLVTGTEDQPYTVSAATLLQGFSDLDGILSVTNLRASNGTVLDNGDGTFTITPTPNFNGPVTLTYDVTDGSATLANQTRGYMLTPVNDAPTGAPTALLADGTEDQPYIVAAATLLQGLSDLDGPAISIVNLRASNGTVLDNGDGTFTVTPTSNFNGPVTLTYDVTDGSATLADQTRTYSLASVADAPTASGIPASLAATEDRITRLSFGGMSFADVDSGVVTVTLVANGGTLGRGNNPNGPHSVSFHSTHVSASGTPSAVSAFFGQLQIDFTSPADVFGNAAASITIMADDGSGPVTLGTIPIDITAVNDAPSILLPGHLDLVVANSNQSSIGIHLGDGTGTFAPPAIAGAARNVWQIALGDLDGDGDLDAVTGSDHDAISVLLGDGRGAFTLHSAIATGSRPSTVTLADVNGDGKPDAVVANRGSNTLSVLLGDGAGGFAAPTSVAAGSQPYAAALGDLDGDGDLDAVVPNRFTNTATVLRGDGQGGFAPLFTVGTGRDPAFVVLADVNGDGKLDALVADQTDNTLGVLLGDGTGDLWPRTAFATGQGPRFVAMADLNGDGRLDAVVASQGSNDISVHLGDGAGGFAPRTSFATGRQPQSVVLGDLNGDGKFDAAVANALDLTVSVLLGDGQGGFAPQTTVATGKLPPFISNAQPLFATLADVNPSAATDEDQALVFSAANRNPIIISDPDGGTVTVTLVVANGTLTLASTASLAVSGDNTGSVTLAGTLAAVNAALDGLSYRPATNHNGADTLTIMVDDGGNGGTPALVATRALAIDIAAVNDAPVLTGDVTLAAIAEDSNPAGATVAALFAIAFTDPDDPGETISGVMVISNPADAASQGVWQASTNGGSSWFPIGDDRNALTGVPLAADTLVRFLPALNYFGTPPGLTVRALDDTYTGPFSVNAALLIETGDETGGSTPISGNSAMLGTSVNAVNDAPVLAGDLSATLDEGASYGLTAGDLHAIDPDDDADGLTLTVSKLTNGTILVGGSAATAFTATQLAAGQVRFQHDGSETTHASFDVAVDDGNEDGSIPVARTFNLTVDPVDDTPPVLTIDAVAGDDIVNAAEAAAVTMLSGTAAGAEDGRQVSLLLTTAAGAPLLAQPLAATVDAEAWRIALPPGTLAAFRNGAYAVTANVTDAAGNPALEASRTFVVDVQSAPAPNAAPVNSVPGAQQVEANTSTAIGGLAIADADSAGGSLTTTLEVAHGTLTVAAQGGAGVAGNGTGSVSISGTLAQINATLAGGNVAYRSAPDDFGGDTLTVTTSDNGNTGSGGALTDTDQVAIGMKNWITGTPGDDSYVPPPGNARIDAGYGVDTIVFDFRLVDAKIAFAGNKVIIDGPSSHTVLTGFERFVFADGTVDTDDGSPLIDDLFYYANYHDVWNERVDADAHFNTFGWQEKRNPDAFFDTAGYLAAYTDVKNAGVNPLDHYSTFGWKEGRDPSTVFDVGDYLRHYADVAAEGSEPLAHFLLFGAAELRATFNDGAWG